MDFFAYRYEDVRYAGPEEAPHSGELRVELRKYKILRWTEKGFWIEVDCRRRFVRITSKKQFAHGTQAAALKSFVARKQRQRAIYHARLADCEQAIYLAEGMR